MGRFCVGGGGYIAPLSTTIYIADISGKLNCSNLKGLIGSSGSGYLESFERLLLAHLGKTMVQIGPRVGVSYGRKAGIYTVDISLAFKWLAPIMRGAPTLDELILSGIVTKTPFDTGSETLFQDTSKLIAEALVNTEKLSELKAVPIIGTKKEVREFVFDVAIELSLYQTSLLMYRYIKDNDGLDTSIVPSRSSVYNKRTGCWRILENIKPESVTRTKATTIWGSYQYKYALTDGKPIMASSVELDFLAAKRGELVKEFKETVKSARRVAREKGNL